MPAETDTPRTDAPAADQDIELRRRALRRPTRDELFRWAGDAMALLILATVLLWWEIHDGARDRDAVVVVAVLALFGSPVLLSESRRLAASAQVVLAAYGVGWLVALAFAVDRHGWVSPLLILGVVPAVGLVTRRVWRRPWGPMVLLALLMATFGRYTFRSWLQWWGSTMLETQPRWMPLSWRNQSGALMGAFGLLFLGTAWCARRLVGVGLALMAGVAFAGVWLSSSRGAIFFTAGAATVMLVAGIRTLRSRPERIRLVATSIGVLATAAAVSLLLLSMLPSGVAAPLESREEEATVNAALRLKHMEAALRMFADRPLVGQGPGSYEIMALDFTDPDANLTTSAHNEYAEVLGEGGLAAGLPFLLLHGAVAILVLGRLRGGVPLDDDPLVDLRGALTLGSVGMVALIGGHSAFDFNWDYPVLPAILAVGAAILSVRPAELATSPPGTDPAPPADRGGWGALGIVLLLLVGLGGHVAERRLNGTAGELSPLEYAGTGAPWNAELRGDIAATLMFDGHVELGRAVVDDAIRWNPGVDRLRRIRAMIRYEQGELGPRELAATLEPGRSRFTSYLDIADQLIEDEEFAVASGVLDDVQTQMLRYGSWGVNSLVVDAGIRQIVIAGEVDGCTEARAVADQVRATPAAENLENTDEAIDRAVEHACA